MWVNVVLVSDTGVFFLFIYSFIHLDFLGKCIGEEAKYEGVRLLFDGLQQPVLNKQVQNTRVLFSQHVRSSLV